MKTKTTVTMTVLLMLGLLISACGGSEAESTPTMSVDAIQTFAVATFASGLTQTALAAPTNTPTPTSTPALLPTLAFATPFGTIAIGSTVAVRPCNGMAYVNDLTIPDNTPMKSGQTFTKTWKVRNSGTCPWDAGFKFAFTGGDAMGGATYTLPQNVAANAEIDISIEMTAPDKTGSIRGNWRMSTAAGQFFGDEIYVTILIGGAGAATNTGEPVPTATNTPVP